MAAKTKTPPAGQLGDWLENIHKDVQAAADEYDKAHAAKSKALGKLNTKRDNLIEVMKAKKCKRCPIRNGDKYLELESDDKISIKAPKAKDDKADSNGSSGRTALS